MILDKLLEESPNILQVNGSDQMDVAGITYDSRQVKPGWLFVALSGQRYNGTGFVANAVSNGAVAVISETDLDLGSDVTHIQVENARMALADISSAYRNHVCRELKLIGITGTNGKTTTAFMIRDLLRDGGFLPGLLGTVIYEIGGRSIPATRTTPEAPEIHAMLEQMSDAGCDSAVIEVSSHAIAQHRVHGISFNIGVFTNLTQDHLDYHKDMESYFKVKQQFIESLEAASNQSAVINIDDPWGNQIVETRRFDATVVTYGFSEDAMVRASDPVVTVDGTSFQLASPWGDATIKLQLFGRYNIHNALAAIAVGGLCGIELPLIKMALSRIINIPGRLEMVPNRKGKRVFVDYAHTDDALKNVLTTLREICKGRLVIVFGCGGNRDIGKRKLMGAAAAGLADYSIITTDNPRNEDPGAIAADIEDGFQNKNQFEIELDRRKAIGNGLRMVGRKDILLIAGKGHETYQEVADTIIPFNDRETVVEILG